MPANLASALSAYLASEYLSIKQVLKFLDQGYKFSIKI